MDRYVRARCETLEDSLQASLARCAREMRSSSSWEDTRCRSGGVQVPEVNARGWFATVQALSTRMKGVEESEVLDDIERWGAGHRRYALRSLGGLQSEALQ